MEIPGGRGLLVSFFLETGSLSDGLLEFGARQQISEFGLQEVRLCLVGCGGRLSTVGHQHHALLQLVLREPLTFVAQFDDLVCNFD